jgi:hypothetical protein
MSSGKKPISWIIKSVLGPVLVTVLGALLVGSTEPWWSGWVEQWWKNRSNHSPSVLDLAQSALPLQVGTYALGSNYVSIHKQGERFCLWDGYIQNHTVASILEDPNKPNVYQVRGYGGTVLIQKDYSSIIFKGYEYETMVDFGDLGIEDDDMKLCLDSSGPFYVERSVEDYQ